MQARNSWAGGGRGLLLVASALGRLPLSPGLYLCLPLFPSRLLFLFYPQAVSLIPHPTAAWFPWGPLCSGLHWILFSLS